MKHLTAAWLLLRGLWHVLGAWFTIRWRFARWSEAQRQAYVQQWAQGLLHMWRIGLQVRGAPAPGPVLRVANHISWLDIPVLHAAGYCRFVSKADVARWPLIGAMATGAGTLYIARTARRDVGRMVQGMAAALQAGDVLTVFPEGGTSNGLQLLPFHANLLQAAIAAPAPVQPVALQFVDARTGQISLAPCYVGDESLLRSVWRTLCTPGVQAIVSFGPPQAPQGRERRAWAHELRDAVDALRAAKD